MIFSEPPMDTWQPRGNRGIIATGHQAALWHPGILAKDIAAAQAARRFNAKPLHIVVDQDAHDAATLELPVNDAGRLSVRRVTLGTQRLDVPTGMQPAIDPRKMVEALRAQKDGVAVDVEPLIAAIEALPDCRTLAEQMSTLTTRMMQPYTGDVPLRNASSLVDEAIVEALLADAATCAQHYNEAVGAFPGAGMTPLRVERDRIELPLWSLHWNAPRRRVFADVADAKPLLVDEVGDVVKHDTLAPRALLLTAIMRSLGCDLFVHGRGGWVYDRITEQWWERWRGETLAPMALVSADVYLPFDAPVADDADVAQAVWYAHHLPHNIDRYVDDEQAAEKRDLLGHMDDDRDTQRRAEAFARLHDINAAMAQRHPELIAEAQHRLDTARTGAANRAVAGKRDWFFGLYPQDELMALVHSVHD